MQIGYGIHKSPEPQRIELGTKTMLEKKLDLYFSVRRSVCPFEGEQI